MSCRSPLTEPDSALHSPGGYQHLRYEYDAAGELVSHFAKRGDHGDVEHFDHIITLIHGFLHDFDYHFQFAKNYGIEQFIIDTHGNSLAKSGGAQNRAASPT